MEMTRAMFVSRVAENSMNNYRWLDWLVDRREIRNYKELRSALRAGSWGRNSRYSTPLEMELRKAALARANCSADLYFRKSAIREFSEEDLKSYEMEF